MRIINLSFDDFSNFSFSNSEALKSVGIDCHSFKLQDHPFKYPKQSDIVSVERMIEEVKKADVVQFFHDNISLFNLILPYCKDKKLIAYHTTSLYRKEYERLNAQMNPYIYRAVNCMPEFMGKGAKNEVYMVGAVDSDYLGKYHTPISKRPYIIAHYPSNPSVKGTERIIETINKVPGEGTLYEFRCSAEQVGYEDQLKRISECDIYIEMLTEKDRFGSDYANFGITALEASAMGKIVVTQCKDIEIYEKHYGSGPFCLFLDADIETLSSWFYYELENSIFTPKDRRTDKHGYKNSGQYILKNIL